ncbi:MAG: hypothetical protein ACRC3H_13220 [Lachnospiraceae bacterium]
MEQNNYSVYDTTINFHYTGKRLEWKDESKYRHYSLWKEMLSFLSSIGFYVDDDREIKKRHPILNKDHKWGRYNGLEFKTHRYPSGFEIEFYQNLNYINPHGGYYDLKKYEKMPYLMKKQFDLTVKKVSQFFEVKGIANKTKPVCRSAVDKIMNDYIESWHHPQKEKFDLRSIDGESPESYNRKDRDGKDLKNGQTKYFRWFDGYLRRGTVYHNINNMWWVILNKAEYTNIANFNLFDLTENDKRGRLAEARVPMEFIVRKENIEKATTKELINELRRRRLAAK